VEVKSYYEKEGRVVVSIKDEGPGIARADHERIFEPFFTTKSDGEGTGLGLCIVRNIVETNSGVLQLHSDLGIGAEFRCVMPVFTEIA
jgi:signal transduction histidine kinase